MPPHLVDNPPNPWHSTHCELLGPSPRVELLVYEEDAGSIVNKNNSPDIPYDWGVNPYRGCFHACAYCYARPTHEYLDWGAGTDFDRRIVVKRNAAELLRQELAQRSALRGEWIVFSGITDCYQPVEASYALTRSCIQVCAEFRNPVDVITKGVLVERDIDVLQTAQSRAGAFVYLSIPFADDATGRAIEPFAAPPTRRFEALRRLSEAGIPTGVSIAPLIPGLNDHAVPEILERSRQAGAVRACMSLLHLSQKVLPIFERRLRAQLPLRADKVLSALRDYRQGKLTETSFGARMRGVGPRWQATRRLFELQCRRHGLVTERVTLAAQNEAAQKPAARQQGRLF